MATPMIDVHEWPDDGIVVVRGMPFEDTHRLHTRLRAMGHTLLVVCLPDEASLDVWDEATMNAHGWYRRREEFL